MGKVVFVVGGAKSGKSSFALRKAFGAGKRRAFIATATETDPEMRERIRRHREERGKDWVTFEEPLRLRWLLDKIKGDYDVALIDCVTLWLTNMIMEGMEDDDIIKEVKLFIKELDGLSGLEVFLVSNEVGLSIVPENPLARRFRDLAGKVNQLVASGAEEVYFIVCGIAQRIK
ncbi:MAG: bifunctional adenosylcobinamide kinase/adenosylcobinamide-phosphate guanylyltransferase [Nitrospirae bacterium]|nr:MAG: bifunctional adenosylcobinamide kinase/adenosylcobinamide-phosphate guanylyltransferase [Nitrospirota bacterium]